MNRRQTVDRTTKDPLRHKLEAERERVNGQVTALRADWRPEELEAGGDNTPLTEEADASQVIEERETGTQRLDWLVDRAESLGRALTRLDEGTYGTCESCGGAIAPERLEARPEATLCIACQADQEQQDPDAVKRRPVLDANPMD
jgi:RNA polymerase-binding transcription factor